MKEKIVDLVKSADLDMDDLRDLRYVKGEKDDAGENADGDMYRCGDLGPVTRPDLPLI